MVNYYSFIAYLFLNPQKLTGCESHSLQQNLLVNRWAWPRRKWDSQDRPIIGVFRKSVSFLVRSDLVNQYNDNRGFPFWILVKFMVEELFCSEHWFSIEVESKSRSILVPYFATPHIIFLFAVFHWLQCKYCKISLSIILNKMGIS